MRVKPIEGMKEKPWVKEHLATKPRIAIQSSNRHRITKQSPGRRREVARSQETRIHACRCLWLCIYVHSADLLKNIYWTESFYNLLKCNY